MAREDRVSPYVKIALGTAIAVFIVSCTVGVALWMAAFTKPPERRFPNLIGMKAAEAKPLVEKIGVRLIEHEQFNEKYDAGIIFRSDWEEFAIRSTAWLVVGGD